MFSQLYCEKVETGKHGDVIFFVTLAMDFSRNPFVNSVYLMFVYSVVSV